MATILCFGDSLTHGARPDRLARLAPEDRWPERLARVLAPGHRVIAEGLNGRTTVFSDPQAAYERAGAKVLPTLLHSHAPLDLVIVLLGTNDIMVAERSARAAARGLTRIVEIIRHHPWWGDATVPDVLLLAPPKAVPDPKGETTKRELAETAALPARIEALARDLGCGFFDAGSVAGASPEDGIHMDAAANHALADALLPVVTARLARAEGHPTVP